jgi:hypothetical protein
VKGIATMATIDTLLKQNKKLKPVEKQCIRDPNRGDSGQWVPVMSAERATRAFLSIPEEQRPLNRAQRKRLFHQLPSKVRRERGVPFYKEQKE